MRIITGKYKSRKLVSPSGIKTRPTSDRARETLFNILSDMMDFEDKSALDLYCGTGSFGIECISRGASFCTFVDIYTETVKKNIINLNLKSYCRIIKNDVIKFLKYGSNINCNLIFADPPYDYGEYEKLLKEISKYNAFFILEHSCNFSIPALYSCKVTLQRKSGIAHFTFFNFNC